MELVTESLGERDPDGVAVLARESADRLGVGGGEFLLVRGPEGDPAVAQVLPDDGVDAGHVRLGDVLRRTANVEVGEAVTVESVAVESADSVTVGLPEGVAADDHVDLSLRDELVSRAVVEGQVVPVTLGTRDGEDDRTVPVRVTATEPTDTVVVRAWTRVGVAPEPADGLPPVFDPFGGARRIAYADVGGLDDELARLRETVELPLRHPELFSHLGVETPRGVVLYGPPGTGKTLLAKALATETDVHFETVSGPAVSSPPAPGDGVGRLRDAFEAATADAPGIVFVDELDALGTDRGGDADGAVARLLSILDDLDADDRTMVVGTTNRLDAVAPALRRPGRFDREIEIPVPNRDGREEILSIHTRAMPLADDVAVDALAERTHGFVGADLANLTREAALRTLRRAGVDSDATVDATTLADLAVTAADFEAALRATEPSALREVFVEVPDVTWEDVGGLEETTDRLRETVQWPLEYPEAFDRVSLRPAKGVLLYGPPGTGKTLLAKVVANEARSNFISIKGPELLNKFVGESEKGVREVFEKARANAPTVVFFDEIDAIAAERRGDAAGPGVSERVVSQLLTELDGLEELEDVVVIATTNRPDLLDDALLRPGRFDRHVHVGTPDEAARRKIFAVHTRDRPLADDVDLAALAARTDGFVGADVEAVCREAASAAVRDHVEAGGDPADIFLTAAHFEAAVEEVDRSHEVDGPDGGRNAADDPFSG